MADRMVNPWLFCFHHNFSKNYPQNSNMGCIDASRRQLQSVIKKLGSEIIFKENMVILLYIRKVPNFYPKQLPPCAALRLKPLYMYVYIRIRIRIIQIMYTNKTVRLYYMAPTMRNGSETVSMTIARACLEESIS